MVLMSAVESILHHQHPTDFSFLPHAFLLHEKEDKLTTLAPLCLILSNMAPSANPSANIVLPS